MKTVHGCPWPSLNLTQCFAYSLMHILPIHKSCLLHLSIVVLHAWPQAVPCYHHSNLHVRVHLTKLGPCRFTLSLFKFLFSLLFIPPFRSQRLVTKQPALQCPVHTVCTPLPIPASICDPLLTIMHPPSSNNYCITPINIFPSTITHPTLSTDTDTPRNLLERVKFNSLRLRFRTVINRSIMHTTGMQVQVHCIV